MKVVKHRPFHLGKRLGLVAAATFSWTLSVSGAVPGQQAYVKASNTGAGDQFGSSVAVSGDTMVIGAPYESSSAAGINGNQNDNSLSDAGAAYVFVRNGTNWTQQAYLKASNPGGLDFFGSSVAVWGDTVVVGAYSEDSNATGVNGNQSDNSASGAGAVYVFVRNGTNWSQQAYLKASNTRSVAVFGVRVAICGDTLVVGAYGESSSSTGVNGNQSDTNAPDSGAAYVFVRNGTTWSQQAYLKPSNTGAGDLFGRFLAIDGDTVVVGAYLEDSNATGIDGDQSNNSARDAGAVYVFVRNGTDWSQQAYLKGSNTETGDYFGHSVAISGDTILVGAYGEDSSAVLANGEQFNNSKTNSGAAYVFVRTGTNWSQQAYLKASNTGTFDSFGHTVALDGDTALIGAYAEDSGAKGLNGNQGTDGFADAGAAYVFVRSGTNWCYQAYVKASNTDTNDQFSYSALSLSGDTFVVGALLEDSSATGLNGSQTNNNVINSGAAYVFTGLGTRGWLSIAPNGTGGFLIRFDAVPGTRYRLERALSLTGPWTYLSTVTGSSLGLGQFNETAPPLGQAFYRTFQP